MTVERQPSEWLVPPGEARTRLDRFLTARGELGTRSQIQRLIADGNVRVDGRVVKAGTQLRAGQRVTVARPTPQAVRIEPEPIQLDVLHEDASLLVINKPPGLVVHPAPGHWHGTVVNALLHRWRERPGMDPLRLGIVHRLDKDTSGVLVVAKDAAALAAIGRQFRRREVQKQYLALAWGRFRRLRGAISEPIGRHPVDRKRMAVRARGRAATTRYEVLEGFAAASLVRVYPETGRTHQIRVHLAALGHPVIGDTRYARGRPRGAVSIDRQALHAESICFRHPASDQPICVSAPLPADFWKALCELRGAPLTSPAPLSSVRVPCTSPFSERDGSHSRSVRARPSQAEH